MSNTYNSENIKILRGLEPVRERPAMYIGSTDSRGLHHLVYEVVDNSIDEALAGYCTHVQVVIHQDGSVSVEDNGRGIPVDPMKDNDNKTALETVLTVLHAGGKFDKNTYQVSGGLHGVGVSVVNALSVELTATVWKDGYEYRMFFSRGQPQTDLEKKEEDYEEIKDRYIRRYGSLPDDCPETKEEFLNRYLSKIAGTMIRFKPDSKIFETVDFDYDILAHRMRELAFLNSGITISIADERCEDLEECSEVFSYEGGISEYVRYLNHEAQPIHESVIYFGRKDEEAKVEVDIAFQYAAAYSEKVYTYVNSVNTKEGGTHLEGFRSALTKAINKMGKENKVI
ncbi:ATP-binding protein, partial [Methanospirillum hungatei]|uniref:ATP-binding protein n=1 Tax=Methanospirillum hungatei TaxID=2203 RepID=UPI0026EAD8CB